VEAATRKWRTIARILGLQLPSNSERRWICKAPGDDSHQPSVFNARVAQFRQYRSRPLPVICIGRSCKPEHNLSRAVAQRRHMAELPTVHSVASSEPVLDLKSFTAPKRRPPSVLASCEVFGINSRAPPPTSRLLQTHARVVEPALIKETRTTIRFCRTR